MPLFCQALDGNASDKVSLLAAVEALAEQLRPAEPAEETPETRKRRRRSLSRIAGCTVPRTWPGGGAGVRWISRVPDTSQEARAAFQGADGDWQQPGSRWDTLVGASLPAACRGTVGGGAHDTGRRAGPCDADPQGGQTRAQWEKRSGIWPTSGLPASPTPRRRSLTSSRHVQPGRACRRTSRPCQAEPNGTASQRPAPERTEWQIQATLRVDEEAEARQTRRDASFLVATNVLRAEQLADQELIQTYTDQHSVERGFAFLKDPLFLASSVFVKKPERIVALWLVMVLCLLVYRLAEHRLRAQLAATGQTVPSQLSKPDGSADDAVDLPVFRGD